MKQSATYEEEISVPEDMSPEQAEMFKQLVRVSHRKGADFANVAAEIIARDQNLSNQYLERHRKMTVEKVAAAISGCKEFVNLPIETVKTFLDLPAQDSVSLVQTLTVLAETGIKLTQNEVKEAIDLAHVIHVMEEEKLGESEEQADQMLSNEAYDNGPPDKTQLARMARGRLT